MIALSCTMGDVVKSIPASMRLREEKVSIRTSLELRRVMSVLDKEYEMYIEEEKKLLDIHAEKDAKGNFIKPEEDKIKVHDAEAFSKDLDELFSVKLELDITRIKLSDINEIKISASDIEALYFLFVDDLDEV